VFTAWYELGLQVELFTLVFKGLIELMDNQSFTVPTLVCWRLMTLSLSHTI